MKIEIQLGSTQKTCSNSDDVRVLVGGFWFCLKGSIEYDAETWRDLYHITGPLCKTVGQLFSRGLKQKRAEGRLQQVDDT